MFHSEKLFKFTQTSSAEFISIMLCKSERMIRQWISQFVEAGGVTREQVCYGHQKV